MKKLFIIFLAAISCYFVNAQSVGIGTNTPNAKALLDISSTTKGVLLPRMTTSQRFDITTPPNGLVVYDTDKNEFYHHDGLGWKALLNSDYWRRPLTSRSRISNTNDSVGIGLSSPTEWLDVDGNIRSRNNILADNDMTASGKLSVGGDIKVEGKIYRPYVTGSKNLVPVCMGLINNDGTIINGTGNFSVTHTAGTSRFVINCTQFSNSSIIMVTAASTTSGNFEAGYDSPGKLKVYNSSSSFSFYFIVY